MAAAPKPVSEQGPSALAKNVEEVHLDEADTQATQAAQEDAPSATVHKKKKKSGAAKKKAKKALVHAVLEQSEPPSVGLSKMFPNGQYPVGEIVAYDESLWDENRKRETDPERRERERIVQETEGNNYNLIRKACETHRQVRQYAQRTIKPGMSLTDAANLIEDGVRALVEENGLEAGIGFPTGLNLNEIAAHFSPNTGDKHVIGEHDVIKIDIGVQNSGRICDSAFTMTWEDTHRPLLDAVKAATNEGIKQAGIDARLGEIGAAIQEVMESHEYEVRGKTLQVKCIENLQGHSIERYMIHGKHSVPIVAQPDLPDKMEENEYYAIETFGSTGRGYVVEAGECSHYAKNTGLPKDVGKQLRLQSAKNLLRTIDTHFGTLPWARRYLERTGQKSYLLGLKHLVEQGIVQDYPPLVDEEDSMTAQFEHTILLRPTCKEIISRGDDY